VKENTAVLSEASEILQPQVRWWISFVLADACRITGAHLIDEQASPKVSKFDACKSAPGRWFLDVIPLCSWEECLYENALLRTML